MFVTWAIGESVTEHFSEYQASLFVTRGLAWVRQYSTLRESFKTKAKKAPWRENPGEVRAQTCGTKPPSRSEALRFIDSPGDLAESHKLLKIAVNSTLNESDHVKRVHINCARKIRMLKRPKRKLHSSAFKRINTGAFRPKMDYACTEWSGGPTSKLLVLQRTYDVMMSSCL